MGFLLGLLLSTTAAVAQGLGLTGVGGNLAAPAAGCTGSAGSITLVHHNAGGTSTTLTGTTAGNFIIVGVGWCSNPGCNTNSIGVSSVTSTNAGFGETCSQVAGAASTGLTPQTDIWYCPNIVGGSDTITVTMSGSASFTGLSLSEWSGVNVSSPIDGGNTANAGSGTTSSVTTSPNITQNGELIYSVANVAGGPALTPGQTGINAKDEYQKSTGVSCSLTNTFTWTPSGAWAMSILAVKH